MALHQRTVIRRAVCSLLVDATAAGARVYPSRSSPIKKTDLPAILVYPWEETSDAESTAPRELKRELDIRIEAMTAASDDVDDALDALALEIETAMHADPFLDGEAGDLVLTGTEIDIEDAGDRQIGMVRLTYSVTYRTFAPEPPVDGDLDDFVTAHVDHKTGGADQAAADDAEDDITLQDVP